MNKLFQDFKPTSTEEWLKIINKDLKGGDFKRLMRKTIDGLVFEPFYRKENTENLPTINAMPEKFPFIRGYKLNNDWIIKQDFLFEDVQKTHSKISQTLKSNVKAIGLEFEKFNLTQKDFDKITEGVETITISALEQVENALPLIKNSEAKFKNAFINYDPLTQGAFTGKHSENADEQKNKIAEMLANDNPKIKTVGINLHHYANAGATPVMQLAFGLSIAASYLNNATNKNVPIEKAIENIHFNIATSCEYFMEIAKIRALRYLFAKLIEAYDEKLKNKAKTHIHGVTTRRNKTIYDAHVNMLRTTIETLAGVVGGVNSYTTEPYNTIFSTPDEFALRIALNQQIIIKEEAYADKVADPAGGSYYVENLTVTLIEQAWKLFLEIQENGCFCKSLKQGNIQKMIAEVVKKEQDLVNKGRISILGTNKYPNSLETLKKVKINKPKTFADIKISKQDFEPIKIGRLAEKFEQLRIKTEEKQEIPKVFLFTYGHKAMRRARADFAGNFFAVAGFKIIDNIGFDTIEQGVNKIKEDNANIIVLCSSDDAYLEMAEKIKSLIKDKTIVVAGNPETRSEIQKLGIEKFINIKSNIYEELLDFCK